MSTNAEVITALEADKAVLQGRVGTADLQTSNKLMMSIHALSDEIGEIQGANLANANYIPQTDSFDAVTAEGRNFVDQLNELKAAFSTIGAVAGAVDQILRLIGTLGL